MTNASAVPLTSMHDLHVADKIHKLILENALNNHLSVVKEVVIELGSVIEHGANINAENLVFNLQMLNRGTLAQGANISIKRVIGNEWKLVSISGE